MKQIQAFQSISVDYSATRAVFEIELPDHDPVYMSISRSNYYNDERFVLVLDAEKFLKLWRKEPNSPYSKVNLGNTETWKNHPKYHHAARGFSYGVDNPVPLAEVYYRQSTLKIPSYSKKFFFFKKLIKVSETIFDFVGFSNGITRTIWLLVHGAKYFPVECHDQESADQLAKIAGYAANDYYLTVEQLTTVLYNNP